MDVQRPAQSSDGDEQVGEIRLLREQFGELVDDDEQRRERFQRRTRGARTFVLPHVREVPRRAKHLLTPVHLPRQRVAHPVDHRQLFFEVGDDGCHMRARVEAQKRCPTLEVDQDEIQSLGRMGADEREHQGTQELRFARPRRTDAEPVWTHPALGCLLDVDLHGRTAGGVPDRDAQPRPRAAGCPCQMGVEAGGIGNSEQTHQTGVGRSHLLFQIHHLCCGRQAIAGHRSGEGLRFGHRQRIHVRELFDSESASRADLPVPNHQL